MSFFDRAHVNRKYIENMTDEEYRAIMEKFAKHTGHRIGEVIPNRNTFFNCTRCKKPMKVWIYNYRDPKTQNIEQHAKYWCNGMVFTSLDDVIHCNFVSAIS